MFKKSKFSLICMAVLLSAIFVTGCGAAKPESKATLTEEISEAKKETTEEKDNSKKEQASTATEESKKPANNVKPVDTSGLSSDWKDCQFMVNDQIYSLCFDYTLLEAEGWSFNLADYGYEGGYSMNAGDKVTGTINLTNDAYDSKIAVGFENTSEKAIDITECQIWSYEVNNSRADKPVTFALPSGITMGSTFEDIKAAYGEPSETYVADGSGYTSYTYFNDYTQKLRLTVYNDAGLTDFSYQLYN